MNDLTPIQKEIVAALEQMKEKSLESYAFEYKSFFALHHFKGNFAAFCFVKICACGFFKFCN